MEALSVPTGYQALMPYLILRNASDFTSFAAAVFGASQTLEKPREGGGILHAELQFQGQTIMYCDAMKEWSSATCSLFVFVPDVKTAYQKALELGSESLMEPREMAVGLQGGIRDPFGNTWWITEPGAQ